MKEAVKQRGRLRPANAQPAEVACRPIDASCSVLRAPRLLLRLWDAPAALNQLMRRPPGARLGIHPLHRDSAPRINADNGGKTDPWAMNFQPRPTPRSGASQSRRRHTVQEADGMPNGARARATPRRTVRDRSCADRTSHRSSPRTFVRPSPSRGRETPPRTPECPHRSRCRRG